MLRIFGGTAVILAGIMSYTAEFRDPGPTIYQPIDNYKVQRYTDESGRDTIKFWTVVKKVENCNVENGSGPVWVDLVFKDDYVTSSALYNEKKEFAGKTRGHAGDSININGYFFIGKDHDVDGVGIPLSSAVINVPCEMDAEHKYRSVIATLSPISIPDKGTTLVVGQGYKPEEATVK